MNTYLLKGWLMASLFAISALFVTSCKSDKEKDATNEAKPGTNAIVLSGGYDNNYEYTLINGTMVIIDTTGINAIELDLENNLVYDLNGLRITETENLTRGIYIINGRKVFVK